MFIAALAEEKNRFLKYAEEASEAGRDTLALCNAFDAASREDPLFGTRAYASADPILKHISDSFAEWDFSEKQGFPYSQKRNEVYNYFSANLKAASNLHTWRNYKKAYAIDPDFYRELVKTEAIRCDFDLMSLVPFPAFYIDLSLIPLPHTNHYQNVQGIIVSISKEKLVSLTIVDENNNYGPEKTLAMAPVSWSDCKNGKYRFVSVCLEEEQAHAQVHKDNALSDLGIRISHSTTVAILDLHSHVFSELMIFTVQFLMFLGSRTTDIVRRERTPNHFGDTDTPVECWDVGIHYGKKIRLLERKRRLYGDIVVNDSAEERADHLCRKRPRPYVRSAHWHKYWCGTDEDRHIELRWLEPTFCNGSLDDMIVSLNAATAIDAGGSGGEEAVADYLTRMHVPYDREYTVSIAGHSRRYDFLLKHNGKTVLIEFDGEQHFFPVERFGGQEAFQERRRADRDKTKWARQRKIPLLRIRFDQSQQIPDLIDAFLDKPNLHRFNPALMNEAYYDLKAD